MRCLLATKAPDGTVTTQLTDRPEAELPSGDVTIRVAWSSVNYKDALSASGHPGVTKKFPHVPGIDAAGTVEQSGASGFQPGDNVLVTGYDLGQNTWGGYAERIRVPAEWVVLLPAGLTHREAMIYGTAGFTAAQCVAALHRAGIEPQSGEILVTGASGGVGSLAVAILAKLGYNVVAATGKPTADNFLISLGARRVVPRDEVCDTGGKPLLPVRWAGGVDTVGGHTLATVLRSTAWGGCVAACGLVGGAELPLTVYPFILRGVVLAGVDSVNCPMETRRTLWQNLAGPWRPSMLDAIVAHEATLPDLPAQFAKILAGGVQGRVLVRID